jgi:predicted nucleic acid-binding protein
VAPHAATQGRGRVRAEQGGKTMPPAGLLKQLIAPHILAANVALAEPIVFEVLRYATDQEAVQIQEQFRLLPVLSTPADLWHRASALGRTCRRRGVTAGAMDLLISTIAIAHDAKLVTFDADFEVIGRATGLRVEVLKRPG